MDIGCRVGERKTRLKCNLLISMWSAWEFARSPPDIAGLLLGQCGSSQVRAAALPTLPLVKASKEDRRQGRSPSDAVFL